MLNNSRNWGLIAPQRRGEASPEGGAGVLLRVHRILPSLPGLQLLRWGADPRAEPPVFSLWCEPARDRWLIGRGLSAAADAPPGDERFLTLGDLRSRLFEQVRASGAPIPSDAPAAWLTSRFHAAPLADGAAALAWRGWPTAQLRVPAEVAYRSGGRTGWVGQAWVEDPRQVEAVLEGLNRRAEALGALMGPPPPEEVARCEREALPERERWLQLVEQARETLAEGELRKLVLARALRLRRRDGRAFSPARALERLVERHADQAGAIVFAESQGDSCFLGASPEPLFRLSGQRLTTQALAGTAPAELDPERALLADPKTRREHGLVVDAIRAALAGRSERLVAASGPSPRRVGQLWHLETPIAATLRAGQDPCELLAALHPTPALGGDPRQQAQRWLRREEGLARGAYGAPLGWLSPAGEAAFLVAIRSALLRGSQAWAFAGAGIVPASDPAAEWAETELKLRPALEALDAWEVAP